VSDERWMRQAVEMARRGLGLTAPNPSVGAVVVSDGQMLGEGHTRPVGGPHAERIAIRDALEKGRDLHGATLYATLEPCCHQGRTPPCTDAIIDSGIARVVVGIVDPFDAMQGKSLQLLRDAGIEVELGVLASECARVVRGFTRAITSGLPEVTCKAAITLDGRIATRSGESKWITGQAARTHGHCLRHEHDAILVGSGTLRVDNPKLTCRLAGGSDPVPVVLDTEFRTQPYAAIFGSSQRPVLLVAEDAPERELPADIVRIPRSERGLDIEAALRALAARGLHRVLAEGGAGVHRSLLEARLVDNLCVFIAGMILPGGQSWVGGEPIADLGDALRFKGPPKVTQLGDDVLLTYLLQHAAEEA